GRGFWTFLRLGQREVAPAVPVVAVKFRHLRGGAHSGASPGISRAMSRIAEEQLVEKEANRTLPSACRPGRRHHPPPSVPQGNSRTVLSPNIRRRTRRTTFTSSCDIRRRRWSSPPELWLELPLKVCSWLGSIFTSRSSRTP